MNKKWGRERGRLPWATLVREYLEESKAFDTVRTLNNQTQHLVAGHVEHFASQGRVVQGLK